MAYEQHLLMCYYRVLLNWIISKKKILLNFQFTGLATGESTEFLKLLVTATLVRTVELLRVGLILDFFFLTCLHWLAHYRSGYRLENLAHKGRLSF